MITDLAGSGAQHDVAPVGLHATVPPPDVVCHVPPKVGCGQKLVRIWCYLLRLHVKPISRVRSEVLTMKRKRVRVIM